MEGGEENGDTNYWHMQGGVHLYLSLCLLRTQAMPCE